MTGQRQRRRRRVGRTAMDQRSQQGGFSVYGRRHGQRIGKALYHRAICRGKGLQHAARIVGPSAAQKRPGSAEDLIPVIAAQDVAKHRPKGLASYQHALQMGLDAFGEIGEIVQGELGRAPGGAPSLPQICKLLGMDANPLDNETAAPHEGRDGDHGRLVDGHAASLDALQALGTDQHVLALEHRLAVGPQVEGGITALEGQYLGGTISEANFLAGSRPWDRYTTDYRALVELARVRGWPVVAANVPRRLASAVGRRGLALLDGDMIALTTILIHESGATCTATLHMRPSKSDPQGVGSATTYARRYALLAMAGAAPEDDDGNAASGLRQEPRLTNVAKTAADIKPPTLKERADRLEATLKSIEKAPDLDKAFALASALLADLDAKDPERLADLDALYKRRQNELAEKVAA